MKWILSFLLFFTVLSAEENFLLVNGSTGEMIMEMGSSPDERMSPSSTFKIALSLMGFEEGILVDESTPLWPFKEGYTTFLESWRAPQTPRSWMRTSCVWYSQVLASHLGLENTQKYVDAFEYGNRDLSGEFLKPVWINSTLKISAREQVDFLRKMNLEMLPISKETFAHTKALLFLEELPHGWKLYGKTGTSLGEFEIGWFVGWVEKDDAFLPFAYNIREKKIDVTKRIPRVKELLQDLR